MFVACKLVHNTIYYAICYEYSDQLRLNKWLQVSKKLVTWLVDTFQPRANFDIRLGPFVLWIFITFNKKDFDKVSLIDKMFTLTHIKGQMKGRKFTSKSQVYTLITGRFVFSENIDLAII
jgi:hypothetical protein